MAHSEKRLRICISAHNPVEGGGVLAVTRALVRILNRQGHELRLLWPSHSLGKAAWRIDDGPFPDAACFELPSIPQLEALRYTVPALFGRRIAEDADIYQSIGGPNLTALPLALWGKPYVCWMGTTLADERAVQMLSAGWSREWWYFRANQPLFPITRRLEAYACRAARRVLAQSSYTARAVETEYGVPPERIQRVPAPVDTSRFNENVEPLQPVSGPFILTVARADDPRKNLPMLLRAFSIVRDDFPDLHLVIVGKQPETPRLQEQAGRLGVAEFFHLLGSVADDDIPRLCRGAEVFALSSLQEGLGIAGLEAMACGTPVVATRCGGPEDYVLDGRTGLLVTNNDAEAFAGALAKCLRDAEFRASLGTAAAALVRQQFSFEAVEARFIEVYKEAYPELFG